MQRKTLPIAILLIILVGVAISWYFSPQQKLNRKINQLVKNLVLEEGNEEFGPSISVDASGELMEIGRPAVPALLKALKSADNPDSFDWLSGMLAEIGDTSAVPILKEFLKHKDYEIRAKAGSTLHALGDTSGFSVYTEGLSNEDPENRSNAAFFLGVFGDKRAVLPLIERLRTDEDAHVRENSAVALGRIGDKAAIDPLVVALEDREGRVFACAMGALRKITGQSFGFNPDAPKEDQEKTIKKWQEWWAQNKSKLM